MRHVGEEPQRFGGFELRRRWERAARGRGEGLHKVQPAVGPPQLELHPAPVTRGCGGRLHVRARHAGVARHRHRQRTQQLLRQRHPVLVVRVGHVRLNAGELGVVRGVDPLVAEALAELVHAVDSPDHEPFQVQFRRHPQEQLRPQHLAPRDERPRRCAARRRRKNRGLDLEEPPRLQEPPHTPHNGGAADEGVSGVGIGEQVQVPVPIPQVRVTQPKVLLGQQAHTGCEDGEVRPEAAHLSALVSSNVSLHPNQIPAPYSTSPGLGGAGVASVEKKVEVCAETLAVAHDLHFCSIALELQKNKRFSRSSNRVYTTSKRNTRFRTVLAWTQTLIRAVKFRNGSSRSEIVWIKLEALVQILHVLQVCPAPAHITLIIWPIRNKLIIGAGDSGTSASLVCTSAEQSSDGGYRPPFHCS
mmetsp:Transcript_57085/g.119372  ORF Transcript_57085/g.119372 Transcript_57085/m.119372 type:complete len:416 (-) Transcript_57085:123-1370(-)